MRKVSKFCTIIFIVSSISSCKINNSISSHEVENVIVIKFMGTITTQPTSISEKVFWTLEDEHAKLIIKNIGFINDVKEIQNHSSEHFEDYNYAFIIKNHKAIDTLYSDYTLKSWILKKNNKLTYYYDEKGKVAENLRHTYSFFRDCW